MKAGMAQIGRYNEDGTVGRGGEFRVTLVELEGSLFPHLGAFGDGAGALRQALDAGLLDVLAPVNSRDEFSRRLLAIRMIDCLDDQ